MPARRSVRRRGTNNGILFKKNYNNRFVYLSNTKIFNNYAEVLILNSLLLTL